MRIEEISKGNLFAEEENLNAPGSVQLARGSLTHKIMPRGQTVAFRFQFFHVSTDLLKGRVVDWSPFDLNDRETAPVFDEEIESIPATCWLSGDESTGKGFFDQIGIVGEELLDFNLEGHIPVLEARSAR